MIGVAREARDAGAVGVIFASADDAPPCLSDGTEAEALEIPVVGVAGPDAAAWRAPRPKGPGKKPKPCRLKIKTTHLLGHSRCITAMRVHNVVESRAGKGCDTGQLQRLLSRSFSTRFG